MCLTSTHWWKCVILGSGCGSVMNVCLQRKGKTKKMKTKENAFICRTCSSCNQQSFPETMPGWTTNNSNTTRNPFDQQQQTRSHIIVNDIYILLLLPWAKVWSHLLWAAPSWAINQNLRHFECMSGFHRAKQGYPAHHEAVTCWWDCGRHGSCARYSWSNFTELWADNTGAWGKQSRPKQRAKGPTYEAGFPACTQGAVGRVMTGLRVGGKDQRSNLKISN